MARDHLRAAARQQRRERSRPVERRKGWLAASLGWPRLGRMVGNVRP